MYNVTATFVPSGVGASVVSASRRIGFRQLVLVTVNDTDPGEVAAARSLEGNGNHTLLLRLNGPSSRILASCSVRRALLTPQVNPGSRYRCGTST